MLLRSIDPKDELRGIWPKLRDDAHALREKLGEPWLAEDIWLMLVTGKAVLFVAEEGIQLKGWMVCERVVDPYNATPILHVWVAVGFGMLKDRAWVCERLDEIARSMGARIVRFTSPRQGWVDTMKPYFEPKRTIWEREVGV